MFGKKTFLLGLVGFILVLLMHDFTSWDIVLQNHFFDSGKWWVDQHEVLGQLIFYKGTKLVIGIIAVSCLMLLIYFCQKKIYVEYRKGLLITILAIIIIPLVCVVGKDVTNMSCPRDLTLYGGTEAFRGIFQRNLPGSERGRCFPAGHASGGFALMALATIFSQRRIQYWAIFSGLVFGFIMGGYQILKGAHFLSHTFATLFLSIMVIALLQHCVSLIPYFKQRS